MDTTTWQPRVASVQAASNAAVEGRLWLSVLCCQRRKPQQIMKHQHSGLAFVAMPGLIDSASGVATDSWGGSRAKGPTWVSDPCLVIFRSDTLAAALVTAPSCLSSWDTAPEAHTVVHFLNQQVLTGSVSSVCSR